MFEFYIIHFYNLSLIIDNKYEKRHFKGKLPLCARRLLAHLSRFGHVDARGQLDQVRVCRFSPF